METAREGLRRLKDFFWRELGAPSTLSQLGIPADSVPRLAAGADLSCWSYRPLTREDVEAILRSCV